MRVDVERVRPAPPARRPTSSSPASAAPRSPPTPRWPPPRGLLRELPPRASRAKRVREENAAGLRRARGRAAGGRRSSPTARSRRSATRRAPGPIARGELSSWIDIWPRDKASRCWADMTRTFVAGGERAARRSWQEYWGALRSPRSESVKAVDRPGAVCRELHGALLRALRGGGQADGCARRKQGERCWAEGLLPRPRARGRPRGPRAPEPRAAPTRKLDRGRRRGRSSRVVTGRASGASRLEDLLLVTEDGCEVSHGLSE